MAALFYNFLTSNTEDELQVTDSGICQDANFDISQQEINRYINEEFSDDDFAPHTKYTNFSGNMWDSFSSEVGKLILQVEAFERLNLNTLITEYQSNIPQTQQCNQWKIHELFQQGYLEQAKQFNKSKTLLVDPLLDDASEKYRTFSSVNHELQQVQRLIVEIRATQRIAQSDIHQLYGKQETYNKDLPLLRSQLSNYNKHVEDMEVKIEQASSEIELLKLETNKSLEQNYAKDKELADLLRDMYNFSSSQTQISQDSLLYDFQDVMWDIKKDFENTSVTFRYGLKMNQTNVDEKIRKLQAEIEFAGKQKINYRIRIDQIKKDIENRDLVQVQLDISRQKSLLDQCQEELRNKQSQEADIKIRYEKAHNDIKSINFKDIPIQKDKNSYSELKALLNKYADLDKLCFQQCHRQASLIEQIEESEIEWRQQQIWLSLQEVQGQLNHLQSMI